MKRIILGAVILLVAPVAAIVSCALITYHRQPELTADEMKQLDEQGIWKERTSAERARIIEDNDEALKERIRMISNAKSEITVSYTHLDVYKRLMYDDTNVNTSYGGDK